MNYISYDLKYTKDQFMSFVHSGMATQVAPSRAVYIFIYQIT